MKYILVDELTGNVVQSTRSNYRIEFSKDVHDSALFASAENAHKALRKIYDKNGNYKCGQWSLKPENPGEHPLTFFVTEAARDQQVARLQSIPCYIDRAENEKKIPIQGFNLKVRPVQFTIV